MTSKFIVFEGIDGAGKTTQIKLLLEELSKRGIKCFTTAEPTEYPSGKKIREALSGDLADCTKIIIAQRISSVQDADMIIVLDKGEISAVGKHDELRAKSDIYREVYEQQTGGNDNE